MLPLLLPTTFETPLHQDPQRATSGAPRAPCSSIPDDVLNAPATRRPSRHLPQHFQHNASLIRIASTTSARNPVLSDSLQLRPDACQPTAVPDLLPSAVATMQRLPPSPPPHPCPTDTWPVHRRHCNMPNHPAPPSPSARRAASTVSPYPSAWTLPLQSCCSSTRAVPHSVLRTLSLPRDHADHRHCNMPNHPVPPSPSARRAASTVSPYPSVWTILLQSCCLTTRAVPHSLLRTLSLPRDHADHRHCNMPNHPVPPSPSARRATSTVSPYPSTWTLPLQSCCSSTRAVPHSLLRTLSLPRDHAEHLGYRRL